jgi:hypothetical protein
MMRFAELVACVCSTKSRAALATSALIAATGTRSMRLKNVNAYSLRVRVEGRHVASRL